MGGREGGAQTGDCSLPKSECQRPRSGRFLGQGGEEIVRNHARAGLRVRCPKPWGGGGGEDDSLTKMMISGRGVGVGAGPWFHGCEVLCVEVGGVMVKTMPVLI